MLDVLCQKIELLTLSLNQLNPSYNLCIIFMFTSVVHIDNFLHFQGDGTGLESSGQFGGGMFYWKRRKVGLGLLPIQLPR